MRAGQLDKTLLVLGRQWRAALADPGPSFLLPMMPPLLMTVVFTSVFDSLAQTAGFTADRFASFGWDAYVVLGAAMLVALLGAGYTSSSLASDLRSGYAERLHLTGMSPGPVLTGRLLFESIRLIPGIAIVIAIGILLGGTADNGLLGVVVLTVLIALLGAAFTGIFHIAAIATADPQTPFTMQPLGLPLAFLSSALVPVAIMPGWSRAIARLNPISIVVDAGRQAMLGDVWSRELGIGMVVLAAWIALSLAISWRNLHLKLTGA